MVPDLSHVSSFNSSSCSTGLSKISFFVIYPSLSDFIDRTNPNSKHLLHSCSPLFAHQPNLPFPFSEPQSLCFFMETPNALNNLPVTLAVQLRPLHELH